MSSPSLSRTPFYDYHVALGAKMVDFAGYEMPIYYDSIKKEHLAVRSSAGLFDVSHMGEFMIKGAQAKEWLSRLTPNDVDSLVAGKAQYTALLNDDGCFIDDILIYAIEPPQTYMLVVNASNIEKDKSWILQHRPAQAELMDISERTCLLALQGPCAQEILQPLSPAKLSDIGYYHFVKTRVSGVDNVLVSATGYTGEKGFEIYFEDKEGNASQIWNTILESGKPKEMSVCGLGCRDTLRLEMGFPLYGNDIDETINPKEAKLGWIVKSKYSFIGKEALATATPSKVRVGFTLKTRGIARPGQVVLDHQKVAIGKVTSATMSPTLDVAIGMAYVDANYVKNHESFMIDNRGTHMEAIIGQMPFLSKK